MIHSLGAVEIKSVLSWNKSQLNCGTCTQWKHDWHVYPGTFIRLLNTNYLCNYQAISCQGSPTFATVSYVMCIQFYSHNNSILTEHYMSLWRVKCYPRSVIFERVRFQFTLAIRITCITKTFSSISLLKRTVDAPCWLWFKAPTSLWSSRVDHSLKSTKTH